MCGPQGCPSPGPPSATTGPLELSGAASLPPQAADLTQGKGVSDGVTGGAQLKISSALRKNLTLSLPAQDHPP